MDAVKTQIGHTGRLGREHAGPRGTRRRERLAEECGTEVAGIRLYVRAKVRGVPVPEHANLRRQVAHFHSSLIGAHQAAQGQHAGLRIRSTDGEPIVTGEVHADNRHLSTEAFDKEGGQVGGN